MLSPFWWACVGAALSAGPGDGEPAWRGDLGPIAVRVDVLPRVAKLSETIEVSVTASAPPNVEIEAPNWGDERAGCAFLNARADGPDRMSGPFGELLMRRWTSRWEPLRLGEAELGNLEIRYREANGEWRQASAPLPKIDVVAGPTSSDDPATLRPIPDIGNEIESIAPRALRWFGVAIAVALILRLSLHFARRGARPTATALAELQAIADGDLEPRPFIERVAQAVRVYLESAYRLRAPTQTTPEFLADPATSAALRDEQRLALAEFLESADVEKFAEREPDSATARHCLQRARAFLAGESHP